MDSQPRYVAITNRLTKLNAAGAAVISAITLATTWGHWRTFAIVLGVQSVAIVYNFGYNHFFMARMRERGEILRTVVNTIISLVVCSVAGWPLSQWFVLPYLALVSEHSAGQHVAVSILVVCVAQDAFAILSGVPWIYPLCFTVGAWFCYAISKTRFGVIGSMLAESDTQRQEVERAHHELRAEVAARQQVELELRQAQKLEAIGRLAAGVAHEINTPVQFVSDSVHFIADAVSDCAPLMHRYQQLARASLAGSLAADGEAVLALEREVDFDYLLNQVPVAAARSLDGLARIATIVRSLKEFAHPGQKAASAVDLNQAIRSTLVIASHEYKLVADIETSFASLPPVWCHIGEINQVVLNVVVNAAHAIADVLPAGGRGKIGVKTYLDDGGVVIEISDTGGGIPAEHRPRIFEPFFTTKGIGKGTGQGLAIARTVVEKHGGKLSFESVPGRGTTFFIHLPLRQPAAQAA